MKMYSPLEREREKQLLQTYIFIVMQMNVYNSGLNTTVWHFNLLGHTMAYTVHNKWQQKKSLHY